ncbi:MAG: hydrogenase maturation protease [Tepidisphaeraceae bacterium]|jgi:hydrogenase maturation protease
MQSLSEHLNRLHGHVCLMCVGNPDGGDDAFGVRLGEDLAGRGMRDLVIAGNDPERFLFRGASDGYDHLIFVDAVDFGAAPGSAVFLDTDEMTGRFPQVSTHRLSLGLLARWIEARGTTKAWLLGVQPESLEPRHGLSRSAQAALETLSELLQRAFSAGVSVC